MLAILFFFKVLENTFFVVPIHFRHWIACRVELPINKGQTKGCYLSASSLSSHGALLAVYYLIIGTGYLWTGGAFIFTCIVSQILTAAVLFGQASSKRFGVDCLRLSSHLDLELPTGTRNEIGPSPLRLFARKCDSIRALHTHFTAPFIVPLDVKLSSTRDRRLKTEERKQE